MTTVSSGVPRSTRRVVGGLAPFSLLVQVCSFASSVALTRVLGADAGTDAYYVALSIPLAAYSILLVAVRLGAIPALTEQRESSSFVEVASEVVSATALWAFVVTGVVTAIAAAAMPIVVSGPAGPTAQWVVVELAPLGVLGAVTGSLGAVLAVRGKFAPAVAVMTIEPVLKTALTLAAGHAIGINALILGNVVGSALAAAALWWTLDRDGVRILPRRPVGSTFVRNVVGVSLPLVVSQSVLQANPIVDRTMAGAVGPGSVTALEIGLRICLIPTSLLTGLMITPITATWAERKLRGGWPALRQSLSRALGAILVYAPVLVLLGLVLRRELVGFAYQGGAYSPHALHETISVFAMTLPALPAQLVVVVVSTLFVIERATTVPMLIGIANVVLNVVLNLALRPVLGVAGIALSTTATIALLAGVYVLVAHRRWRPFALDGQGGRVVLGAVGAGVAAAVALALRAALPVAGTRPEMLVVVAAAGGAGCAAHLLVLRAGGVSARARAQLRPKATRA